MNFGRTDLSDVTSFPEAVVIDVASLRTDKTIEDKNPLDSMNGRISEIFYLTQHELKNNLKWGFGCCMAGCGMSVGGLALSAASVVTENLKFSQFLFGFLGASIITAGSCFLGFGVGGIMHKMGKEKVDAKAETEIGVKAQELSTRLKNETSIKTSDQKISKIFYLTGPQMESWASEAQHWINAGFCVTPTGWILHAMALTFHPEGSKLLLGFAATSILTISGLILGFGLEGALLKGRLTKVN